MDVVRSGMRPETAQLAVTHLSASFISSSKMFSLLLLIFYGVSASDRDLTLPLGGPKLQIQVSSSADWCMFLPPNVNESIAASEGYPNASPAEVALWAGTVLAREACI